FRGAVCPAMDTLRSIGETLLGLSKPSSALDVGQLCLRAAIVYLVMILFMRLAKKRSLGRATVFDAILGIIIGSTASRAVTGNAPFFGSLAAVLVLIAVHWLISLAARDWPRLGWLVKGQSDLLIKNGKVDHGELKRAHMTDDDLAEDLRQKGVSDPADVKEARLERDGVLSVIKR
ncbi:MAG TPA: YetF domain-containing protein, partial [Pseudolabrys sp.]|nr:YetF domain-containing protein [Pseudolabrys sp.]